MNQLLFDMHPTQAVHQAPPGRLADLHQALLNTSILDKSIALLTCKTLLSAQDYRQLLLLSGLPDPQGAERSHRRAASAMAFANFLVQDLPTARHLSLLEVDFSQAEICELYQVLLQAFKLTRNIRPLEQCMARLLAIA